MNNYYNKNQKTADELLNEIGYIRQSDTDEERTYKSDKYVLTIKKQYFTYKFVPIDGNLESKNYPSVPYRLLKAITAAINELIKEKYNKNKYKIEQKQVQSKKEIKTQDSLKRGICLNCNNMFSTPGVIKQNNVLVKVCPKCKSHNIGVYFGEA